MFTKDYLDKVKKSEEQWRRDFSKNYPGKEKELHSTTSSGIPIKAVYTPLDIEDTPYEDSGMPGEFPYTRGVNNAPYNIKRWEPSFLMGFGSGADARERQKFLLNLGVLGSQSRQPEIDLPTKLCYDPDHPFSRGRVGLGGVSISKVDDLDELLGDEDPAEIDPLVSIPNGSMPLLAMYIVCAERRGVSRDKLRGCFSNTTHQTFHTRMAGYPPQGSLDSTVELIKYCRREMPRWRTLNLSAYNLRESGINAFQELALILGAHITIVEESIKEGLDPDDFIRSFQTYMDFEGDFFEEIAKLRAFRRLWAKINKERFGCKSPESLQLDIHLQTGGLPLTRQQPLRGNRDTYQGGGYPGSKNPADSFPRTQHRQGM
jgi:methylmalonyl-CoA mutase N-terminal domain/subunit